MIKGIRSNSSKKDLKEHKQVTFENDSAHDSNLREETFGAVRESLESKGKQLDLKAMAAQLPGPNYGDSGSKSESKKEDSIQLSNQKSENPWDKKGKAQVKSNYELFKKPLIKDDDDIAPLDSYIRLGKKSNISPDKASSQATQMSEIKIDPSNILGRKSLAFSNPSTKDGSVKNQKQARAEIEFNLHDDEAEFATKNSSVDSQKMNDQKESKTFY